MNASPKTFEYSLTFVLALAGTLGSFNEGTTGPGHCDEDASSSAAP